MDQIPTPATLCSLCFPFFFSAFTPKTRLAAYVRGQYFGFVRRVHTELDAVVRAVSRAGVRTKFTFRAVGAGAEQVLSGMLDTGAGVDTHPPISGGATIRIDDGRSLRFSFGAPSTLVAHLSQATLAVSSIPQLTQLLHNETEQALLRRICATGSALTEDVNGAWFVDLLMGRAVGRWEGCLLNFKIAFAEDATIRCAASWLYRASGRSETTTMLFTSDANEAQGKLFDWLNWTVQEALGILS
ncbi:unnamed protein product [Peniophora sp. CBMAI 1063]|nr:unnamed protein product [Peniophora sp. CBMAI 1063]